MIVNFQNFFRNIILYEVIIKFRRIDRIKNHFFMAMWTKTSFTLYSFKEMRCEQKSHDFSIFPISFLKHQIYFGLGIVTMKFLFCEQYYCGANVLICCFRFLGQREQNPIHGCTLSRTVFSSINLNYIPIYYSECTSTNAFPLYPQTRLKRFWKKRNSSQL